MFVFIKLIFNKKLPECGNDPKLEKNTEKILIINNLYSLVMKFTETPRKKERKKMRYIYYLKFEKKILKIEEEKEDKKIQ